MLPAGAAVRSAFGCARGQGRSLVPACEGRSARAAALAVAAFAAGSAYADLYRLKKARDVLTTRLANESAEVFNGDSRTADAILDSSGPGGVPATSPMPKLTAYDILLDISAHVPARDKITLDLEKMSIDDTKIDLSGTTKKSEEIDLLVTELKKIECFKNNVSPGSIDTLPNGVQRFKLTITASAWEVASHVVRLRPRA